jgi:hypothetical protein
VSGGAAPAGGPTTRAAAASRHFPVDDALPGARRTALLLHALGDQDRSWLLARLPADARRPLAGMLDELRAVGIPATREVVEEALALGRSGAPGRAGDPASVGSGPPAPTETAIAWLEAADARALAAVLAPEPPMLVARLLAARPWTWRDELFAFLGSLRSAQVRSALDGLPEGMPAPALVAWLAAALRLRVGRADGGAPEPTPGQPGWPGALRGRMMAGLLSVVTLVSWIWKASRS